MARPRYIVTAQDVTHATAYLTVRLRNYGLTLDEEVSNSAPETRLHAAVATKGREVRAQQVNAWCEINLNSAEWQKLKTAVRKRRERMKRHNDLKTVTISARAFELLAKLSKRDNVTYSAALERYLPKALNAGRGRSK